jgi:hypothetical protein
MLKRNEGVLPKGEAAKPEDTNTGAGISSPVSVKVHLNGFVEHTIATSNGITLDTLTEISGLAGQALHFTAGSSTVGFEELQVLLV